MQALLISNRPDEADVLDLVLRKAGFTVRSMRELDRAIENWPENPAELIVITLPEERGRVFSQIEQIRSQAASAVIVIGEKLTEAYQVDLYEHGVDLIIQRPYSAQLLLAQVRALLRRSAGVPSFTLPEMTCSDVTLDPATRRVSVGGGELRALTQLEFRLLFTLMSHVAQIIPTDRIVEHVWGYSGEGNRELVRGLVQRLRSKVEPDPRKPRYILTHQGIGYYFKYHEQDD